MTALPPRNNLSGALWLITDMSLNIWALSIVKAMGPDVPAAQVVFLRSVTGFVLILPWIAVQRRQFRAIDHARLHLLRVVLAAATLTASFYAIARVPLALFTAIGFTRPVVTMIMAAVLLRETVLRRHWVAAAVALVGVIIAVRPGDISAPLPALAAQGLVVVSGSAVVIATRRLRAAPTVVMMAFYTGGLGLATGLPAAIGWVPLSWPVLGTLLAVGLFAQAAQFCYLKAQFWGEAAVLSLVSYLSLVLSAGVGVLVFGEAIRTHFVVGACLVVAAALSVTLGRRPSAQRHPTA